MATSAAKPKLANPWRLLSDSVRFYFANFRRLVLIVAVASLPFGLLVLLTAGDATFRIYGSVAALFMNLALFWTITRLDAGEKPSLKQSYYEGTAAVIRFIVFTLIIGVQLLPFVIGASLFSNASADPTNPATTPERILVGILWLVLSIPSARWFSQSIFGFFGLVKGELPVPAVRTSRKLVKGRTLAVLGRLVALGALMLVIVGLPLVAIIYKTADPQSPWIQVEQLVMGLVLLPVSYIYLFKLYQGLK